jgi:UPF0271 protein
MKLTIDLNCDLGESFGRYALGEDEEVMAFITSANVACGMHAGDPPVIDRTVQLAARIGVSVGAHPGYPDLQGFGRRVMDLTAEEVEAFILYQVGAVAAFARAANVPLVHVKPHGALYNQAAGDLRLAAAVARGVARFSRDLILVGLAGSALTRAGLEAGLRVASEGFPDRAYNPDGSLRSRRLPGAVLESDDEMCAQAVRLAQEGIASASGDHQAVIPVDTLCIHGDHPGAARRAALIRQVLEAEGITVQAL